MSEQLRDDIWDALNDADYLNRYYGQLAGRMTWRERLVTYVAAGLAIGTLSAEIVPLDLGSWRVVPIFLTAIASIGPLLYRTAGRIAMASYREHELAKIRDEWKLLWQDCESDSHSQSALRERWYALTHAMTMATAMESREPVSKKIRKEAENASRTYWTEYAARPQPQANAAAT